MALALREMADKIERGEIVVTDCQTENVLNERREVTDGRVVTICYQHKAGA